MVSMAELVKIQQDLERGERERDRARVCYENVAKLRRWLAVGEHPVPIKQKLEQLLGRFGSTRFGGPGLRR